MNMNKCIKGEGIKKGDDCTKIYEGCSICGKIIPRNLFYKQWGYYICPDCLDDDYNHVIGYHDFNDWQPKNCQ